MPIARRILSTTPVTGKVENQWISKIAFDVKVVCDDGVARTARVWHKTGAEAAAIVATCDADTLRRILADTAELAAESK